jgi:ABC-2 type transport system ATP-binding protein
VQFDLAGADRTVLTGLPGVTDVDVRGDAVRLTTADSDATVRALFASDLRVRDLEVSGADLEEAFLALTSDRADQPETSR